MEVSYELYGDMTSESYVVVVEVQVHPSARRGKGRDATLASFIGSHDLSHGENSMRTI